MAEQQNPGSQPEPPIYQFTPARRHNQEGQANHHPRHLPADYGELHAKMVEQHAPPSILVNHEHEVVHCSAKAGRYLMIPGGEPTRNVFTLVIEPLRIELRAGLHLAAGNGRVVRCRPVTLVLEGRPRQVVLRIRAATDKQMNGIFLVIFDEYPITADETDPHLPTQHHHVVERDTELDSTPDHPQAVVEEYETSRDEIQSSNPALHSAHEEQGSAMQDPGTSRETLRSKNEQLSAINQNNQHRVKKLSQHTSDLENLLAATDIAMLFLDGELRITWFSRQVSEIFNIHRTDKGRPLSELTHRLINAHLDEDVKQVHRTFERIEREVHGDAGRWYLMRVLPYRNRGGRAVGVTIMFIDITQHKQIEQRLREAHDKLKQRVSGRTAELQEQRSHLQQLARELAAAENRERKRLAALLHDDLQQYLVALKMHLTMAQQRSQTHAVGTILNKGIELVDQAMKASSNLTQELRPPMLYEDGLVPALRWLATKMAERHGLEVTFEPDADHTSLHEDIRAMLFECVRELLFNVVKHAGVKHAKVILHEADGMLSITVGDDGDGFDVEAVARRKREGGGLGLFSIRERLVTVGASMEIHSIPGDGARITIKVPLDIAIDTRPRPGLSEVERSVTPRAAKRPDGAALGVLVVDDHVVVRQGLVNLIDTDDRVHVVGEAADGMEAIQAVEELAPDVVLMDVNMPNLNGIEATRRIRERWPAVKVVGLSVQGDPATNDSMRQAGAQAFVSKNDDAHAMIHAILSTQSDT